MIIRDILKYLEPDDRRAWTVLLLSSFAGGLSRSGFLALINQSVTSNAAEQGILFYYLAAVGLLALMLTADFFTLVRGRFISERLTMRLRLKFSRKLSKGNLRLVEKETVAGLQYHLWQSIETVATSFMLFLAMANAGITLICNTLYIAWLSPIALMITFTIMVLGISIDWLFEKSNEPGRAVYEDLRGRASTKLTSRLLGFKELRLSAAKDADFHARQEMHDKKMLDASHSVAIVNAGGLAVTDLFLFSAIAGVGLLLPLLSGLSSIQIMQIVASLLFTVGPLTTLVSAFGNIGKLRVAHRNLARLDREIDVVAIHERQQQRVELPELQSIGLRNVTFRFESEEGSSENFALGPVSLNINKGEVVCIVGGNGSGKTVLSRILTGLYRPYSGELLYNGMPVAPDQLQAYREKFTTVFNDFYLFPELLAHVDSSEKAQALLSYFGLEDKTHIVDGAFSTIELSTGQRKRLALIVSMLDECPIALLDEFAAEQDPRNRDLFYRVWLPELQRRGKTIVIISHDQDYFHLADRLIRMDYGTIIADEAISHDGQGASATAR